MILPVGQDERTKIHHVATVVTDLDESMEKVSAALGLTWATPWWGPIPILYEGEVQDPTVRFSLSRQGPPHVELIESNDHDVWRASGGWHHIGLWVRGVESVAKVLESHGYTIEAMSPTGDFAYLKSEEGTRLELVDRRSEPDFTRWLGGGSL